MARHLPPDCGRAIMPLTATLFSQLSLHACTEWLWAGWTVRYPELRRYDAGARPAATG